MVFYLPVPVVPFLTLSTDDDVLPDVVVLLSAGKSGARVGVLEGGAGDFAKYLNSVFPPGLADILLLRLDIFSGKRFYF